jgi:hypothetical protein
MSFSLFNQDTDLKEGPSPYPLPQERKKEADLPGKGGARPESKGEKDFLSRFRDRIRIANKGMPVKAHFHKSNSYPVPEMPEMLKCGSLPLPFRGETGLDRRELLAGRIAMCQRKSAKHHDIVEAGLNLVV